MDLPNKERSFYFDVTGESGVRYEGDFTIKCKLNIGDKYLLEVEKSRLTSDAFNPSTTLVGLATILATLKIKIIKSPNWWSQSLGMSMEDEEVLIDLYNKVEEESVKWLEELKNKANVKNG